MDGASASGGVTAAAPASTTAPSYQAYQPELAAAPLAYAAPAAVPDSTAPSAVLTSLTPFDTHIPAGVSVNDYQFIFANANKITQQDYDRIIAFLQKTGFVFVEEEEGEEREKKVMTKLKKENLNQHVYSRLQASLKCY